jgi:hypothetical protein
MALIGTEDATSILGGIRRRRRPQATPLAAGLQTPAPGDPGHVTVLELVRWRCGVIVYRAIDRGPWVMEGETMPRVAIRRPKFNHMLGRIAFLGGYAIWVVCAPRRGSAGSA